MSKRKNFQMKRRQIRRALNRIGDAITQVGTRKLVRIGYGCGFSNKEAQSIARGVRHDNTRIYDSY